MSQFYLTIDDSPSIDTEKKLSFLKGLAIKAVWFCIGSNLEKLPDVAAKIIKSGHVIANHSFTHPYFSQITLEKCKDEIIQTEQLINSVYNMAGVNRPAKLFRYPYGDRGHLNELSAFLFEQGFSPGPFQRVEYGDKFQNRLGDVDWLWSYDVEEWRIGHKTKPPLTSEEVDERIKRFLLKYDRNKEQIVLIHDHFASAQYFPKFIKMFIEGGARFVPMTL